MTPQEFNKLPRATVRQTKRDAVVRVDGGFTCIQAWAKRLVERDEHGLFIKCQCGNHYLDGQLNDAGTEYVGLRLA